MNKKEIEEVLEELHDVRPEMLNDRARRLFEAIMSIADERDYFKQTLIDINSSLKRMQNKILGDEKEDELSLKYFTCIDEIDDIIDKVLGDENKNV